MFLLTFFLFYITKSSEDCTNPESLFESQYLITSENCILFEDCVFLSITSTAIESTATDNSITLSGCIFIYCQSFVHATSPLSVLITKSAGLLGDSRNFQLFDISLSTAASSSLVVNCSAPANKEVMSVFHVSNGDMNGKMINTTGTNQVLDSDAHESDAAILKRENGPTDLSSISISNIFAGTKSIFILSNSQECTISLMNVFNIVTWNSAALSPVFSLTNSALYLNDCYLMQITMYDNGNLFSLDQSSSVTADNAFIYLDNSKNIGCMISGSYQTLNTITETPTIYMYKTWFMNANDPYEVLSTPSRTLPTECPPLPERNTPRSIQRIITTASALVGGLQEFI